MWASAGPGPSSSSPKQWKTGSLMPRRMVVLRFTTLPARDRHWRNPRKKNYKERSNIKSAHVSALTSSVPRKMAKALQRVSALIRNRTQVAKLTATHLNHFAWNKWYMTLRISPPATYFFAYRTVVLWLFKTSSWISRPDTKWQNSWTQTFDPYILLHSVKIGVKIFSLFFFAQFLLNAHQARQAAHWPWKRENWELEI